MKKIIILSILITSSFITLAQNPRYIEAMKKNIAMMDSAYSKPDLFVSLANNFERIAEKEKTQWLPYYYASLCKINNGFMQKSMNDNDVIADAADLLLQKADSLSLNNSEISCAKSMLATLRMLVNPQQRYFKFGAIADKEMANAIAQDAANPRPHMLKGQNLKGTPEQFGGGCKTAKQHLQTATEKFVTFKPSSDISPSWGKSYCQKLLNECNQ